MIGPNSKQAEEIEKKARELRAECLTLNVELRKYKEYLEGCPMGVRGLKATSNIVECAAFFGDLADFMESAKISMKGAETNLEQ